MHNQQFSTDLLHSLTEEKFATFARMTGMISMALEELSDVPLYYELARLCNITKLSQGKITLYLSAILNAGYRVSLTHANKVIFLCIIIVKTLMFKIISARDQDRCSNKLPLVNDASLGQQVRQEEFKPERGQSWQVNIGEI